MMIMTMTFSTPNVANPRPILPTIIQAQLIIALSLSGKWKTAMETIISHHMVLPKRYSDARTDRHILSRIQARLGLEASITDSKQQSVSGKLAFHGGLLARKWPRGPPARQWPRKLLWAPGWISVRDPKNTLLAWKGRPVSNIDEAPLFGWTSSSASATKPRPPSQLELERIARDEVEEDAVDETTGTSHFTCPHRTVFKNVQGLQEQNAKLVLRRQDLDSFQTSHRHTTRGLIRALNGNEFSQPLQPAGDQAFFRGVTSTQQGNWSELWTAESSFNLRSPQVIRHFSDGPSAHNKRTDPSSEQRSTFTTHN